MSNKKGTQLLSTLYTYDSHSGLGVLADDLTHCPERFLGAVIGRDPHVSNRLHVDIFQFFFTNLRYVPQIPRKRLLLFPTSSTSTGSSTPSCLFSRFIDLNLGVKNQVSYELCTTPPLIRGPHRVLFVHHYLFTRT